MSRGCILGCAGPSLTPLETRFLRQADPWGFILFARNIEDRAQVRALTRELRDTVGRDAPILVDQEGGRVQRLGPPHWRDWLPPLDQAARASDPARAIRLRYRLIADELADVGIDVNCAPTCDIARDVTHPFLRNRCLGTDPDAIARLARAAADGLIDGGVLPVIKHMPGHGRATLDSHKDLPVVDAPPEALREDFAPFAALADLPMAMTAHIVFSRLSNLPATQDAGMIHLIREEIGFDGLLMTDDISMEALSGSIGERTDRALAAGCDVVLHCNGDAEEMAVCVDACTPLSSQARRRAEAALAARTTRSSLDPAELDRELAALMSERVHDGAR